MGNAVKLGFLTELRSRFGEPCKLGGSQSLYELAGGKVRIYIRYSAVHGGGKGFFGLRSYDLRELEGRCSFVCYLWDGQQELLLVPFSEYEDVFAATGPAPDGQFKVQVYLSDEGTELYIARAGRFNVEGHFGWSELRAGVEAAGGLKIPQLSHSQVQTMLGAIGVGKRHDVWIPANDRGKLDWALSERFESMNVLPAGFERVQSILQEVDVIWVRPGSTEITAMFEVEHSTPVYSGLLRFNDIHLAAPNLKARFSVVSNDERRALFVRQLARPTFQASRLCESCSFLDYANVYEWHERTRRDGGAPIS